MAYRIRLWSIPESLLLVTLLAAGVAANAQVATRLGDHPLAYKIEPALLQRIDGESLRRQDVIEAPLTYRVVVNLEPVESAAELRAVFDDPAAEARMRQRIERRQARVLRMLRWRGVSGMRLLNRYRSTYGFSAEVDAHAVEVLIEQAEVVFVEGMATYEKMDPQSHPLTGVDLAHAAGFTGQGVTIAIIDDGIEHDHPAFGGDSSFPNAKIIGGRDFADNDSDPTTDCLAQSHGTSVTGVAAGDGGGITGTAPDARVVFLKIQSRSICGDNALNGDLPGAIDWAVTNRNVFGIKVISMSLGSSRSFSSPCSGIGESNALNAARSAGMVTVVASGNGANAFGISAPACHPAAVSVGAVYDANLGSAGFSRCSDSTTFADKITCYSNSDTFLDILAPAHCAQTARTGSGTTSCFGGTSSATPFAAGVFATLFEKAPALGAAAAITAVTSTGTGVTDARNGLTKPRVDAIAALNAVGGGGGPGPCAGCVDFSSTATVSYSNQDRTTSGSVLVRDGGATLALTGNRWRRTTRTFTVTASTVIEFDFRSTSQGEIHGIGFDEDDSFSNQRRIFQFFGTQSWGGAISSPAQYAAADLGRFVTLRIRVGDFYTGSAMRLVLVNDKDAGSATNTGEYRNVRIFEDGGPGGSCAVEEDFESGAAGWSLSGASTCSTGDFVLATPTQQVTAGVVTQPAGDHTTGSGNALFTATNTSVGNADVDGGVCIVESPVYTVTDASTLSAWYFHGQRDSGDDPGDDFFRLEVSTNGGTSYAPLVALGDARNVARWTEATRAIPAGSRVRLRVSAADGPGPGDIVEGGIDDISICPQ